MYADEAKEKAWLLKLQQRSSQVKSKRGNIVPIIESRSKSSAAVESSAAIEKSQKIREK